MRYHVVADSGDLQGGVAPLFVQVENDYVWTQFIDNQILPVGMK
jgi:hypothetical protein